MENLGGWQERADTAGRQRCMKAANALKRFRKIFKVAII